ncbi:MAG TPA: hypothetical protein VE242_08465, partial [Chthoniobacterales bacterium]|nr:hypothetical protein [Chthoniobacterales bacterium]
PWVPILKTRASHKERKNGANAGVNVRVCLRCCDVKAGVVPLFRSDISFAVIHKRAERPALARRSELAVIVSST